MLSHLVPVHDRHLDIGENEANVTTTAGALQSFLEVANRVLTIIKTLHSDRVTLEHDLQRNQIERHIIDQHHCCLAGSAAQLHLTLSQKLALTQRLRHRATH